MTDKRNCAFQYAKIGFLSNNKIICDKTELTLAEAKELWNQYFSDAAKHIKDDGKVEMVIWVEMDTPNDYDKHLYYISTDAESDGRSIWVTKKEYFNNFL